jgi:hypothetical protein
VKTILLLMALALICFLPHQTAAQNATRARTETGKDVLLYPDGTWKYAPEASSPITSSNYNKGAAAISSYRPERGDFVIWYNPAKWRLQPSRTPDDMGHFTLIGTDGYAMIVSEGLAIPTESLKKIALENAKEAAPDARIISEEKRVVNGKEILCLVIEGTIEKVPFTYYGYYYGGKQGTIQVLTFTGQSFFATYKDEFTAFLNGLEIKN